MHWPFSKLPTLGENELKGHSNNTWHFIGTFLTMWHFSIFDEWFLGTNCFEILNELEWKYLLKHYLAWWWEVFFPKAFKTVFHKAKKYVWHFAPPPPSECHVLFEWPLNSILFKISNTVKWQSWYSRICGYSRKCMIFPMPCDISHQTIFYLLQL